jgi:hypothetical protein
MNGKALGYRDDYGEYKAVLQMQRRSKTVGCFSKKIAVPATAIPVGAKIALEKIGMITKLFTTEIIRADIQPPRAGRARWPNRVGTRPLIKHNLMSKRVVVLFVGNP